MSIVPYDPVPDRRRRALRWTAAIALVAAIALLGAFGVQLARGFAQGLLRTVVRMIF